MSKEEFSGIRSSYYKEIMQEMPQARVEEQEMALKFLNPSSGERILEVGAGGGFFTLSIADAVSPEVLIATDPSLEQLEGISSERFDSIQAIRVGASEIPIGKKPFIKQTFDAIWSGGSFHHVLDKSAAFQKFSSLLKPGGRLVIADVFIGSKLAKHFDSEVAKYCITGHEVAFLSKEFADSLCYISGLSAPEFHDVVVRWRFDTKEALGKFLYKIHAMTKTTPEKCFERASKILGIEQKNGQFLLNWPLTVLIAEKR